VQVGIARSPLRESLTVEISRVETNYRDIRTLRWQFGVPPHADTFCLVLDAFSTPWADVENTLWRWRAMGIITPQEFLAMARRIRDRFYKVQGR
jgi:hypothetical protein